MQGCTGLKEIHVQSAIPPICVNGSKFSFFNDDDMMIIDSPTNRSYQKKGAKLICFDGVGKEHCIVYVLKETVELYKNTIGWNEFKNIVEE